MILFWQCTVPSGLPQRHCSQSALPLPALRTPHSLRDILEASIPAAQAPECMRLSDSLMTTLRAFEYQGVLAKLIAQFVDRKFAGHIADCYDQERASPSSSEQPQTLYKRSSSRLADLSFSQEIKRQASGHRPQSIPQPGRSLNAPPHERHMQPAQWLGGWYETAVPGKVVSRV